MTAVRQAWKGRPGLAVGAGYWRAFALAIGLIMVPAIFVRVVTTTPGDVGAYWTFRVGPGMYAAAPFTNGAHEYSPVFAQLIAPLTSLPYPAFRVIWAAWQFGLLLLIVGPRWIGPALLVPLVPLALENGNLHFELALVALFGLRWPALWAIALLTKVTPGIGLLWFAVRREWRSLGIALGATAAIVLVSAFFAPGAWGEWIGSLRGTTGAPDPSQYLAIPLSVRLLFVAGLTVWAARTDRPWILPFVIWLALPYAWWKSAVILLAAIPLLRRRDHTLVLGAELVPAGGLGREREQKAGRVVVVPGAGEAG